MCKHGDTPLLMSVDFEKVEMCKFLMDNGALPSINTSNDVNI